MKFPLLFKLYANAELDLSLTMFFFHKYINYWEVALCGTNNVIKQYPYSLEDYCAFREMVIHAAIYIFLYF